MKHLLSSRWSCLKLSGLPDAKDIEVSISTASGDILPDSRPLQGLFTLVYFHTEIKTSWGFLSMSQPLTNLNRKD